MNTTQNPGTSDQTYLPPQDGPYEPPAGTQRSLHRPLHGRMLAGVAAGLAGYFGVDVTAVRIVFAVLAVVGGAAVPIYLACWLLIPEEGSEQSIASSYFQSWQR